MVNGSLRVVAAALLALGLAGPAPAAARSAAFAPSGTLYASRLLLNDCPDGCALNQLGGRELWRVTPAGNIGRGRVLATPADPSVVIPMALSPAGDAVVYADRSRLLRTADIDAAHMLVPSSGALLPGFEAQTGQLVAAWSPDGSQLALAGTRGSQRGIWIVGRDGAGLRRLPCACKPDSVALAWSTLNQLAFTVAVPYGDGQSELWSVGAGGAGLRRLIKARDLQSYLAPGWSPDGRRLVFERDEWTAPHIAVLDVASGAVQTIADGESPTWSPDGTQLAYLQGEDGELPGRITVATPAGQTLGSIPLPPRLARSGYVDGLMWRATDASSDTPTTPLTVFISAAMETAAGSDEIAGARLALADAGGTVDGRAVQIRAFPFPNGSSPNVAPGLAALDPSVIGYLGEDSPDAAEPSLDVLNASGIPQIAPANPDPSLTHFDWAGVTGYKGSGFRTFVRMLPGDDIAATSAVTLAASRGARRVWLVTDGGFGAAAVRGALRRRLAALHVRILGTVTYDARRKATRIAARIGRSPGDAVLFAGGLDRDLAALWNAVHRRAPRTPLYASHVARVWEPADERSFGRGLTDSARSRATLITSELPADAYGANAEQVLTRIRGVTGNAPTGNALAGYESMALLLDAVHRAGPASGRDRIRDALFATRDRDSVLGRYSVTATGDTTLFRLATFRLGANGRRVYLGPIDALG